MSSALYATRLWWHGRRGGAKLWNREALLLEAPVILGVRVDGLDYVPEIALAQIQPVGDRWRDMTKQEIAACDRLLRELVPQHESEW